MRRLSNKKAKYILNNKGFSLVELLISIAILVIIMIPLMGNFIRSMQINKKSEQYQFQSNLAASVMEGLKASTIHEIIKEFNEPKESFGIIPNNIDDILRLQLIAPNEYMKMEEDIYNEQATDYYAIHGVKVGGSAYDVFIKLDAATADYKADDDDFNNFPMPEIVNLDLKANGLLFSDSSSVYRNDDSNLLDGQVLQALLDQGIAYADQAYANDPVYIAYLNDYNKWLDEMAQAEMGGPTPLPMYDAPTMEELGYHIYKDIETIKKNVIKTMIINVNNKSIRYDIEYSCSLWTPITISHNIDQVEYASSLENIYLFYEESIFHEAHDGGISFSADRIRINNNATEKKVKLFVADQNNDMFNPIMIERPTDDSVLVFTNVALYQANSADTPINPSIINTYNLDRIFDITINICKTESVQSNRYKEVYYSLESTMER